MAAAGGTSSVSGLFSGINFRDTIDQIIAIEGRSADLIQFQIEKERVKLLAWQVFNKQLLALKSAGDSLNEMRHFDVHFRRLCAYDCVQCARYMRKGPLKQHLHKGAS